MVNCYTSEDELQTSSSMTLEEYKNYHFMYNAFDFRYPDPDVKILADTPLSEFFWDFYKTYPKAKFILTYRDAESWVQSRAVKHPLT